MIGTHTSTRPEALIPPASLATDFDEWMAQWTFKFNGVGLFIETKPICLQEEQFRYTGKPIAVPEALPGDAWKSFKQEPRRVPFVESQLSPRLQFIASITPPKSSIHSSPAHARHSSDFSIDSIFSARPATKQDPLFKNGFLEVKKSPKGGYGAFAIKDIEVGTVVLSEEPAFRASFGEVFYQYEGLRKEQRAEYRSLHGWSALADNHILSVFKTNRWVPVLLVIGR
jgi:hypothetical protein